MTRRRATRRRGPAPRYPVHPHFHVHVLNKRKHPPQPVSITIRQVEYHHDVVLLQYDKRSRRQQYRKGTPLVVSWGWFPGKFEKFHGYVHSSRIVSKKGSRVRVEVLVTGASFSMNRTRMRSFRKMTAVHIVKKIAREHRFTARTDFSPKKYSSLAQLGRSNWALMTSIAKDIGFTFSCRKTEVQFRRREISTLNSVPKFQYNLGAARGSLFTFKLKAGNNPLSNTRKLVIGGIDDNGKPFWATDSKEGCCGSGELPNFTSYYQTPATSMQSGQGILDGQLGMEKFRVEADVVTSGEPAVRCGSTVQFTDVEPGVQGRWWVSSVEHKLSGSNSMRGPFIKYQMEMKVERETVKETVCVTEPQRPSFSGKPVVFDPCGLPPIPEVSTVFAPVDACAPLETAPLPCRCPPVKCPGQRPEPTNRAPRFDGWSASYVQGR